MPGQGSAQRHVEQNVDIPVPRGGLHDFLLLVKLSKVFLVDRVLLRLVEQLPVPGAVEFVSVPWC